MQLPNIDFSFNSKIFKDLELEILKVKRWISWTHCTGKSINNICWDIETKNGKISINDQNTS